MPSIGHFYGRVVDSKTNKGIDGASVQLVTNKFDTAIKKMREVPIAGQITNKGNFSFENLPLFGNYKIRITGIGYKIYEQKVAFDIKMPKGGMQGGQNMENMQQALAGVDKDLGNIKLEADAQMLSEVTVTASKPLIQLSVDKKIYNVEKDISAQGGSGLDVMRNIPSIAVDIDGNIKLRNSTPTIFVDGLPTTLTLDQIPADAIESVEIITNPGAKYDASGGTSGILNIILKKNRKPGYNGNVRAGIDQRGKFNLGGDLNMKQGKVNVFGSAFYNQRKSITSPDRTTRESFITQPNTNLLENDYSVRDGYFAFARLGLDYFLDNRNTLSISGTGVRGHFSPTINSDINIDTLNNGAIASSSYTNRISNTDVTFKRLNGMLSFKHNFPKAGKEFTANGNYSNGSNSNINNIGSKIFDQKGGSLLNQFGQQQKGGGNNEFFTAQADFTDPLTEKSKFETGARVAGRNISSNSDFYYIFNNTPIHQSLLSSLYSYQDRVYAAYGAYTNAYKDFGYQLGLRAESSTYSGNTNYSVKSSNNQLKDTIGYFSNSYPISLFPSVFLSQKLGDRNEFTLNYTRRIDRPSFFQLFPFTDYSDSSNISRGNPALKPQFTNSFELSYQLNMPKNNTLISSIYYKYTTDLITRISLTDVNPINGNSILVQSFTNAQSAFVGGFEVISRNSITKWWDLTSNLNIFTSKINAIDTGTVNHAIDSIGQTYAWFAKLNSTFKLSKRLTLQISADYTSKTILPPGGSAGSNNTGGRGFGSTVSGNAQGYNKPTGGVDASLKYEFLKNKAASFTLSCSDIFSTRVSDVYTTSPYQFTQEEYRKVDPQFFRLQFNYRFGKFDASLLKRKNIKGEMDSMQGSMQGTQQ
ncbi:MAG: TonB-dependent receptor [Bacteroidetes bacterium]|nr:TonB-dependent receptor [Bacteroidota bacterium]